MYTLTQTLEARATTADGPPPGCCPLKRAPDGVEPHFSVGSFVPPAVNRLRHRADPDRMPAAVQVALKGVATGAKPWPLFLHGPAGTGKTSAALAVSRRTGGLFLDAGWWAWCRVNDAATAGTIADMLGDERVRLVVVDEIGLRERATEWQVESLKLVLDGRFGLPLIVTGNVRPDRLAEVYDERVADRLAVAGTVCHVGGASARQWRTDRPAAAGVPSHA